MNQSQFTKIRQGIGISTRGMTAEQRELIDSVCKWAISSNASEEDVRQELLDTVSIEQPPSIGNTSGNAAVVVKMRYDGYAE
ncbi:TPA: hypothetical protein DD449_00355 [Candidatus Berkelbacteria bacterium]|uniref:Uncharacterized protein n=1 Tax=Berkelbacteria bacterium GW2011_GWE1_39_12 TaxID=1618337 RepID=A0A0G4B4C5_9BACT|nr:MAG: hypothetical protein UT28_C0001G1017 [Berkelbacteria bacterium GW2011_GWE1_39_12]HBO60125.1 hypothetical protein [Candidatus Berkelbacteria bacterium]